MPGSKFTNLTNNPNTASADMIGRDADHRDRIDAVEAWVFYNVRSYGAKGDGVTDDTAAVQAAIDDPRNSSLIGGTVFLPKGTYVVSNLVVKHRVRLVGAGMRLTVLKAKAGSTATGLLTLNQGYAQSSDIQDLSIVGGGNAGQHGIHFVATGIVPDNNGGWWDSGLRRVHISGFAGDCIRLVGGGGPNYNQLLPHQFLSFEAVDLLATATGHAIYSEGQVGQVTLTSCTINGPGLTGGTTVNRLVRIASGYTWRFEGCSIQDQRIGISIASGQDASGITIDGCYFENLGRSIEAEQPRGVVVINPRFANAASWDGLGGGALGACVYATGPGLVTVRGGMLIGTVDRCFTADTEVIIDVKGFQNITGGTLSFQLTKHRAITAEGTVGLQAGETHLLVNTSAVSLITLSSPHHAPGARVTIRAHGGSVTVATGGNIDLGLTRTSVVVPQNSQATFVRFDLGATWVLESLSSP